MSNKQPNGTPGAAEFGQLNAFLAQQGYTPDQRKAAVWQTPGGRTRAQISQQLRGWIKNNGNPGR